MFNNSIPQGSPLVPYRPPVIPTLNVPAPPAAIPTLRPEAPGLAQQLPPPPPSKLAKKPSIWDKEHISETLASISAGFLSSPNFGEGLGAAMQSVGAGTRQLREDQKKSISYGGPDNQFEIATDAMGNRTIREVPEFAAAVDEKRKAAKAPTPKDNLDFRARAVYAISQLPQEQRAAAYQQLMANPTQFGIDVTGMPAEWSDQYGTVAGTMGLNVNQALTQDRSNYAVRERVKQGEQRLEQGERRLEQGERRLGQGEQRLRQSPPSTRRPRSGTLKVGTQMSGRTYLGGDPHDKNSWR